MTKYILILISAIIINTSIVFAEPEQINARILPTIWYSDLNIKEGDTVKVFAGIQNNSNTNWTGNAVFLVDNVEIAKQAFTSNSDTLKDISANWKVSSGTHDIQVKITANNLPEGKTLVAYETNKSTLSVNINITKEDVKEKINDTAVKVLDKTNSLAEVLAEKLDDYKKPDTEKIKISELIDGVKGKVLGTTTQSKAQKDDFSIGKFAGNAFDSAWNVVIDTFKFLINNWKWSLAGLLVLYLLYKFFL